MEKLFAYAILAYHEIAPEKLYQNRLHALFLANPEDDLLLQLDWENDLEKAIDAMKNYMDHNVLYNERFARSLLETLEKYYIRCPDIKAFAHSAYSLWTGLPGHMQDKQPFCTLCYADDPLSWGDEGQTRQIYEEMFGYFEKE